ncbi:MAG: helix-turn-helix transcriptional regulator [Planctomycetes bacterium]|nr:helix-turn-helix transcriptional regulator [Planctomycetota bacterium]
MPEPVVCIHHRSHQLQAEPRTWLHQEHYLTLLLRGDGYGRNGRVVYPRARPLFLFTPIGREDVNGLVGPVAAWWVGFRWPGLVLSDDGQIAQLSLGGERVDVPAVKPLDAEAAAEVTRRFAQIHAAMARPGFAGALLARALIAQLLVDYVDCETAQAPMHRALTRFRAALERRACTRDPLTTLARGCGLRPNRLRELFQQRYGLTPIAYRTGLRIARARELLTGTAMRVSEVATAVGYPDPLYFSRVFTDRVGMPPSELIRRKRG